MTKKLTLPFFIAIYLLSLAGGFGFAGVRQANAIPLTAASTRQSTWIMVRVDDMTLEQPRLVSVWAMFLAFSPGPQVFFKPLYSNEASINKYPDLQKVFNVSADRTVSSDFMKELDSLISYPSGMVILDDIGFKAFSTWFMPPTLAYETRPFEQQTGSGELYGGETSDYNQLCRSLENTIRPSLSSLPWKTMFPNHVLASPSLRSLTNIWEKLILSDQDAHCEVIPVQ